MITSPLVGMLVLFRLHRDHADGTSSGSTSDDTCSNTTNYFPHHCCLIANLVATDSVTNVFMVVCSAPAVFIDLQHATVGIVADALLIRNALIQKGKLAIHIRHPLAA